MEILERLPFPPPLKTNTQKEIQGIENISRFPQEKFQQNSAVLPFPALSLVFPSHIAGKTKTDGRISCAPLPPFATPSPKAPRGWLIPTSWAKTKKCEGFFLIAFACWAAKTWCPRKEVEEERCQVYQK